MYINTELIRQERLKKIISTLRVIRDVISDIIIDDGWLVIRLKHGSIMKTQNYWLDAEDAEWLKYMIKET